MPEEIILPSTDSEKNQLSGLKVLFIAPDIPPSRSGGADFVWQLCEKLAGQKLAGQKLDVDLLASKAWKDPMNTEFTVYPLIAKWDWIAMGHIIEMVDRLKPNIIDIFFTGWMYNDHPMITFVPAILKKIRPSIKIVTHIESQAGINVARNSFITRVMRKLFSFLIGRKNIDYEYGTLLRDSDCLITLSHYDSDFLTQKFPWIQDKITVVPPPALLPVVSPLSVQELREMRNTIGAVAGELVLAYFGYIYPGKGLETLFDAVNILLRKGISVRLLIVGDIPESYVLEREGRPNYLKELNDLAANLRIAEKIYWNGYVPTESDMPSKLLRAADICVLPFDGGVRLHNSSFSFCAAHGLPIITTKSNDTEAEFIDGDNVSLISSGNAELLSRAIETLKSNDNLRKKLCDGSLSLFEKTFSWKQALEKTLAVYKNTNHDF